MAAKNEYSGFYLGDTPIEEITSEERDALARRILTNLCEAWAYDHGVKATFVITKKGEDQRTKDKT